MAHLSKILVHNGIFIDVFSYEMLMTMGYTDSTITPGVTPFSSFGGAMIHLIGSIPLIVNISNV